MTAIIIGILSGFLTILVIVIMKLKDKPAIYSMILTGIGFLYVGYTWSDTPSLLICSLQAICFLLLAYFGIKKNLYFLIAGYFLHGTWDMAYNLFSNSDLIPPHYDMFCLSIDFTIGFYLIFLIRRLKVKL